MIFKKTIIFTWLLFSGIAIFGQQNYTIKLKFSDIDKDIFTFPVYPIEKSINNFYISGDTLHCIFIDNSTPLFDGDSITDYEWDSYSFGKRNFTISLKILSGYPPAEWFAIHYIDSHYYFKKEPGKKLYHFMRYRIEDEIDHKD